MRYLIALFSLCFLSCSMILFGQEDKEHYVPETDPQVIAKISQWQDLKFGLLMHWGTYSQWGIVESWSLCGEDEGWCKRTGPYSEDYNRYKNAYQDLKKSFNPLNFDPERWASAAKQAGMRYVIFTTKHHDGFCMFDTKTTDYKITSAENPFHLNKRANVTKEIFREFRKKNLWVGAYYSKPDWSTEYYWWPYFPTPDRHVNYDPKKYPDRWNKFKEYTFSQISELMSDYGQIDILWLDGAWVRPLENMPKGFESWAKKNEYDQDVDIKWIVEMARGKQPGLIVVDRWVNGPFENYLTPEQKVPEEALDVPWEACMTMATSWSYVSADQYKPVRQIIHLLVDIVAKGGNLLLNIGPSPEGEWADDAYDRLKGIGKWMDLNSEAIYATRPFAPYKYGNVCFTQNVKNKSLYAIYLSAEKEEAVPGEIVLPKIPLGKDAKMTFLGTKEKIGWRVENENIVIDIPEIIRNNPPAAHAYVIKITGYHAP